MRNSLLLANGSSNSSLMSSSLNTSKPRPFMPYFRTKLNACSFSPFSNMPSSISQCATSSFDEFAETPEQEQKNQNQNVCMPGRSGPRMLSWGEIIVEVREGEERDIYVLLYALALVCGTRIAHTHTYADNVCVFYTHMHVYIHACIHTYTHIIHTYFAYIHLEKMHKWKSSAQCAACVYEKMNVHVGSAKKNYFNWLTVFCVIRE